MDLSPPHTPVNELKSTFLDHHEVRVLVKRDDLIHPRIQGNKWRKLKYNLESALQNGIRHIVTYGGAYSNHIAATAAAGKLFNLRTTGIIRGSELSNASNPTLAQAHADGMHLSFVSREDYRRLSTQQEVPFHIDEKSLILPEGGTNSAAIRGCAEIVAEMEEDYDMLVVPMGTGGTAAGVLHGLSGRRHLLILAALKGTWMKKHFSDLLAEQSISYTNFDLFEDDHFGGYGRFDQNLIQFILDFSQDYGILLDPIYTGKAFFRVWDMIKNGQIAAGNTVMMLHTGGLQGIRGFNQRHNLALQLP